jgi:hypothetical protein
MEKVDKIKQPSNYEWLVYKHNHDDVISCDELGREISVARMGIHRFSTDEWNDKEIKWNVSSYSVLTICRLRVLIWERFVRIIAAKPYMYINIDVIRLEFYLIDENGEKITKSPLL